MCFIDRPWSCLSLSSKVPTCARHRTTSSSASCPHPSRATHAEHRVDPRRPTTCSEIHQQINIAMITAPHSRASRGWLCLAPGAGRPSGDVVATSVESWVNLSESWKLRHQAGEAVEGAARGSTVHVMTSRKYPQTHSLFTLWLI